MEIVNLSSTGSICVFSDLHLGNPRVNRDDILTVLEGDFGFYILNGDLIDCYYSNEITALDAAILKRLESLFLQNKLIRVNGNHDIWVSKMPKLFSIPTVNKFEWIVNSYSFVALHGHSLKTPFTNSSLKDLAFRYAKKNNISVICVGHNHISEISKRDGIVYANSGSFFGIGTYIKIDSTPIISLETISKKPSLKDIEITYNYI